MSTNNFKFDNILAVIPDFDFENVCLDEECQNFEQAEGCGHISNVFDFDIEGFNMFIKEIQDDLIRVGFDKIEGTDYDRNYTGNYIAEKAIYNKEDGYKKIIVLWRAGYYDGANVDYIIEDIGSANETEFLKNKVDVNCRKAKKIILKHCEQWLKVGNLSNGEAIYQKK